MTKVAKTKENLKKCICIKCPSYSFACKIKAMPKMAMGMLTGKDISKEDHLEGMFCAYEPSNCIKEKKGCICLNCPVALENKLDKQYFCTNQDGA